MNEILKKLSKEILSGKEVAKLFDNPKDFPIKLVENLSIETALNYWNKKTDFENGDRIMNNLQTFWVTNEHYYQNFEFGKISWECYEAFDAAEYIKSTDSLEINPEEKYSKPLIEKLLKRLNLIE